jgi:Tetratricopeptide repeat
VYRHQERWEEAQKLGLQVLEIRKKVLGQNHLQTLVAMAKLAILWRGQGRCEEAMDLMKQAETLQKKDFGL